MRVFIAGVDGYLGWALACHLAEFALQAAPDDAKVRGAHTSVYSGRAEHESSLMAKGIYGAAARDSSAKSD